MVGNSTNNYANLERDTDIFIGIYGMFVIVIGSIGNVLTLVVIFRYHSMRSTTRSLFFTLGSADLIALPLAATRYWVQAVYHYDLRDKDAIACKMHSFVTTTGTNMALWVIVLIAMERFCQTFIPNRHHPFTSIRWTVFLLVVIFLVLIGKNSPLLTRHYHDHHCGLTKIVDLGSVTLTDCLLGYLVPGVLVLSFTLSMIMKVRMHHKKVKNGSNGEDITESRNLKSATYMLLGVALSRLIMGVPGYVADCLSHGDTFQVQPLASVYRILLIFMITNNGSNFYLYFIFSLGFRNQFLAILSNLKRRLRKPRVEG